MSVYIVTYDLRKSGRNYDELYKAIKSFSNWAKINESVWAIESGNAAVEVRDYLLGYLDSNDSIFVIKSSGVAAWKNTVCSNEWLKKYL